MLALEMVLSRPDISKMQPRIPQPQPQITVLLARTPQFGMEHNTDTNTIQHKHQTTVQKPALFLNTRLSVWHPSPSITYSQWGIYIRHSWWPVNGYNRCVMTGTL
jgi:hypothetical protein